MTKRMIKFRAWNTFEKKYMPSGVVWHLELGRDENDIESYPLEQYTGYKDSNGVEIYEGDFLLAKYDFGHPAEEFGEVKFMDGCWVFDSPLGREKPLDVIGERIEVKGNIHENPEWEV